MTLSRRNLLRVGGGAGFLAATNGWVTACVPDGDPPPGTTTTTGPTSTTTTTVTPTGYGPLGAPDANGLRLPAGFSSRVIAESGQPVGSTGYVFPPDPDGAATFAAPGGGWVHVVNHESGTPDGGASRIEFDATGAIVAVGRILTGTDRNCAGGATPWNTWLSCEEVSRGQVWECDPFGVAPAVARPAMGKFAHEAVAVSSTDQRLYLTEDKPDGGLYRFTPAAYPSLATGLLEVMTDVGGVLGWAEVPDPAATVTSTRYQVPNTKQFNGGEGICSVDGTIYFTTKGDNRVWRYDPADTTLSVRYDAATIPGPVLTGVDNITANTAGDLFVAEDGGDMQIVVLSGTSTEPLVQVTGVSGSEITGPAFSPAGDRLYFSSQRNPGRTYEITGPFF